MPPWWARSMRGLMGMPSSLSLSPCTMSCVITCTYRTTCHIICRIVCEIAYRITCDITCPHYMLHYMSCTCCVPCGITRPDMPTHGNEHRKGEEWEEWHREGRSRSTARNERQNPGETHAYVKKMTCESHLISVSQERR